MLYYVHFTDNGEPETGLTPSWEYLITAENGTDKSGSAPAISELGGGWYKFDVTFGTVPWDVTDEDLLGFIDGGSGLVGSERYKPIAITKRGLALAALSHKSTYTKSTGVQVVQGVDDLGTELTQTLSDSSGVVTRTPS